MSEFDPRRERLEKLVARLQKDSDLLNQVENALRVETRPLERARLEADAQQVRDSYNAALTEYDQLKAELTASTSAQEATILRHVDAQFEQLFHKLDTMQPNAQQKPDALNLPYDVFLSYRRQEPDKAFTRDLLKRLEADGYKVAIDERDFRANVPFLEEMERCVKESRFTVAVVSPRFIESGNAQKEIRIRTVLDMSGRTYCLLPLITEKVTLPTWLYELSSIDFTDPDPILPPYEKLKQTLGNPQ